MSSIEKFQRDRWSLFITFDPLAVQLERISAYPAGDAFELHHYLRRNFGGLPEEYEEVVHVRDDGVIEVTSSIVDWLHEVTSWVLGYTIPREVRLVRNEEF